MELEKKRQKIKIEPKYVYRSSVCVYQRSFLKMRLCLYLTWK